MNDPIKLTKSERAQISDILARRAQEIAGFSDEYRRKPDHFGSVELALTREIERLRSLADKTHPELPED
jgi:hypothetical protein